MKTTSSSSHHLDLDLPPAVPSRRRGAHSALHGTPHDGRLLALVVRRRVVVAVALLDEADEAAGQLRTVTTTDLQAWGCATGRPFDVHEHASDGWLVVDTD